MASLEGKRLLILGGQQKLCDIVDKARELGVYTVVTDWYADSPAKAIADESAMVSTSDVDGLLSLIKEKRIDGVFTGFIDSVLPYYSAVCEKASLPCYLSSDTLRVCTDKLALKQACEKNGIDTIPRYGIDDQMMFPVLVKPTDNSGSKGITVCSDCVMLKKAVEKAERFSKSNSYIIEQFMCCDYVAAYYTVTNGKAALSMLADKDMNRIGRGNVPFPTAFVSPSRYTEQYLTSVHPAVQGLIRDIGFENGTFLISFFVSGSHFYAVELTARLTATREYVFIKDATGVDTLEMNLNYALTGNFSMCNGTECTDILKRVNSRYYVMMFNFLREGIIGRADGFDKIRNMPGVLDVLKLREVGASIRADGSYGQLHSRIYFRAENQASTIDYVDKILDSISVTDVNGVPMLIAGFDSKSFFR